MRGSSPSRVFAARGKQRGTDADRQSERLTHDLDTEEARWRALLELTIVSYAERGNA